MKFLVIEDNENLNRLVSDALRSFEGGCDVESALDGERGLFMAETNRYDLIVLDLMLPNMGGADVLKELRKKSSCPIIILTAINDLMKKVELLEMGADDYMVKPFERLELLARVGSILRRYNDNYGINLYKFKDMEINYFKKQVKIHNKLTDISGKIYDLLEYFTRNKEMIISKDSLFNRVWGFESETISTVVEVYISKLRKILATADLDINLITIKNVGYMWSERTE